MPGGHSSPSSIFQTSLSSQHCAPTTHPFSFFWQFTFLRLTLCFFLPLLPTSKLHLAAGAHTHAHTCSKPFRQHRPFCTHIESSTKCSLMCSRDSSCLASGALPTPDPLLRKKAELLYPPILDEEQLLKSPVPSKIISQSQKRKKQEQKVQHLWCGIEWERKKIPPNSSLPSLSDVGKYQQDTLDKVDFPCFCLELFVFSLWFWW